MSYHPLALLTSPEAAEIGVRPGAIGLVPTGALEQHGPHLPMIMDSAHADALARAVAERIDAPVVVTPAPAGGLSDHHLAFPGTVTLRPEVFCGLVEAYIDALARLGIRQVFVFSGHGGNFTALGELERRLAARGDGTQVRCYADLGRFIAVMFEAGRACGIEAPPTDVHAGALETSVSLHVFPPGSVRAFDGVVGYTAAEEGWLERVLADGLGAVTTNGVLGDARPATVEAGRAIFDALADELATWVSRGGTPAAPA